MRFKVHYYSPDLAKYMPDWGETSVVVDARNETQAIRFVYDTFGTDGYKVHYAEEMPPCYYTDNVEMRGKGQKNNQSMDRSNPKFEEFFAFDGMVYHSDPECTFKADQALAVWNGKFDW